MNALIIDDDSFIRQVLKMILDELSISVLHESSSLADARDALKSHSADVIFLDIMLPDGSGLDLIPDIKELVPDGKIIMISGNATEGSVKEAIKRGASGFVVKPFNANNVVKNIATSLNLELPDGFSG